MSSSSRKPAGTPSAIGDLRIPDPRLWPEGVRERLCKWRGNCGPLDLSIFVFGSTAAMFLSDAITAAGVIEIGPSEWHTEENYPAFCFDSERIGAYSQTLAACGYPGLHQRDRIGLLHRENGLPEREAVAGRRSDRTLGRLRTARGRAAVSEGIG
jgi:hypothetical protein